MIALIQRVSQAKVDIDGEVYAAIDAGLLVLVGVEQGDDEAKAKRLAEKVAGYRVFEDHEGKMNLNVGQVGGDILVVSNLPWRQLQIRVCVLVSPVQHLPMKESVCTNTSCASSEKRGLRHRRASLVRICKSLCVTMAR